MAGVQSAPPDNGGIMKNNTSTQSMRRTLPALAQMAQLIPPGMIDAFAKGKRVKSRRFSYKEQVFPLMLGHLFGVFILNEICDSEVVHCKKLLRIREMRPARRNTFSHANRPRDPAVAETLFRQMKERLEGLTPQFMHPKLKDRRSRSRLRCFSAVDCSVLRLTFRFIGWAHHRLQKGSAKLHMHCDVASRLPAGVWVMDAQVADCRETERLCEGLRGGDVALFDRAYNDSAAFCVSLCAACSSWSGEKSEGDAKRADAASGRGNGAAGCGPGIMGWEGKTTRTRAESPVSVAFLVIRGRWGNQTVTFRRYLLRLPCWRFRRGRGPCWRLF